MKLVETGTIACIVIAGEGRQSLLDDLIMPSVVNQGFDEVCVVGTYHSGNGYRHLPVSPITRSTIDAKIKRDIGTAVTVSDLLVYLSDDHALNAGFCSALRDFQLARNAIGVAARFTTRDGKRISLNTGFLDGYCSGHSGVFYRTAVQLVPWSVAPHHPNWDVFHSQMLMARGYELVELPDCLIEDIEPGTEPWR